MKKRTFLKALLGLPALVTLPVVAKISEPGHKYAGYGQYESVRYIESPINKVNNELGNYEHVSWKTEVRSVEFNKAWLDRVEKGREDLEKRWARDMTFYLGKSKKHTLIADVLKNNPLIRA